jgi:hypothetical protein
MLACLSAEPSRSHRRHGLLYRTDPHFPSALLLFRHQSRPPTCAAFQRHTTSLQHVDRATVAGSFPRSSGFSISHLRPDAKYGLEVPIAVRSMAIRPVRTSIQSPWQNGVAERWIESCRRDLLDHVIAANERHLKRLLSGYVRYYHEDRTHLGLNKETPAGRVRSTDRGAVVSQARLGGLHHRYDRAA